MAQSSAASVHIPRLLSGFVAGSCAALIFHQFGRGLLHLFGITPLVPYNIAGVPPFGVPQVVSLAFWGGLWGVVFITVEPWLNRAPGGAWVGGILFGLVFPTLVTSFVVMPLKGMPAGDGFRFPGLLVSPVVNTLWVIGTALFLGVTAAWRSRRGNRGGEQPASRHQQRPRPKHRRSTVKAFRGEARQKAA